LRGEAKLASLRPDSTLDRGTSHSSNTPLATGGNDKSTSSGVDWSIAAILDTDRTNRVSHDVAKSQAEARWHDLIAERFVHGRDDEFDYHCVDTDETLDADEGVAGTWTEREREAAWFDEEEPDGGDERVDDRGKQLEGETGLQDF
jgi:Coiled-coil domain containing protein (DUF2052)